jgi:hypothetical protein
MELISRWVVAAVQRSEGKPDKGCEELTFAGQP